MIVFDLKCGGPGHVFEAWFASSSAFADQQARKLVSCPVCGDTNVSKAVMAPNVGAKGNAAAEKPIAVANSAPKTDADMKQLIALAAKVQSKMLEGSEWVGREFDRKARAMDSGEAERATIHGQVTPEEAKALIEDGVGVMPLLLPVVPPEKRN